MSASIRSHAAAVACVAALMLALTGGATAGSLDIPVRGAGLSFGNSRTFDGLRINFRDRDLQSIRGITVSLWAPAPKSTGRIQGLSVGLVGTGAARIEGITLNLVGAGGDRLRGLAVGGIGVGSDDFTGVGLGGLGVGGDRLRGVMAGGLGVGGDDLSGIFVGGLYWYLDRK